MNIYLLFGDKKKKSNDLKGGSKEIHHIDWLQCTSVSHAINSPQPSGSAQRRDHADHSDFKIERSIDQASPKIVQHCSNGKTFSEVHIELTRMNKGDSPGLLMEYILKDVHITFYEVLATDDLNSGSFTTERFGLNFTEINVIYTKIDDNGDPDGCIEATCDLKAHGH
ncbi:MAG: hypothetical protein COA78_23020 [Blastopirellula sp.]|nr:MAG: hypothetical protein COA78_23020 [Blastopirellula sp.]